MMKRRTYDEKKTDIGDEYDYGYFFGNGFCWKC